MRRPDGVNAFICILVCLVLIVLAIWTLEDSSSKDSVRLAPAVRLGAITATPPLACQTRARQCRKALLSLINADRAAVGVRPLSLSSLMTYGDGSCIGAQGHSKHMAATGQLAHDQFPADVCPSGSYSARGENIGASPGNVWAALQQLHAAMMAEPWSMGCQGSHSCNIRNPAFTRVGIGIAHDPTGTYWLTEDFEG